MIKAGHAYVHGDYAMLVLADLGLHYIIAIQRECLIGRAQIVFVPVHLSVAHEFAMVAEDGGPFQMIDISESIRVWKEHNGGVLTISIPEIWNLNIDAHKNNGKTLQDFWNGEIFVFPPVFTIPNEENMPEGGTFIRVDVPIGVKA